MIRVRDRDLEAVRQVDRAAQALVPACAPGALPTDPKHLDAMFAFCTSNWRAYAGEKPSGKKLAKINAVYKQATLGDFCADTAECPTLFEKTVMTMWRGFKGTPAATAKRRFIALLRDVDARLLQVKAYQVTPWGFPTTAKGERICPYSNAKKGCPRPLVDKYGHSLELELDNKESLAKFTELRKWLDEVATQQQCSLGLHTPIAADKGAKFKTFFSRVECGGFRPYMSTGLHQMVKKVLTKQLHALVAMQNNPRDFSRAALVLQRDRFCGLQQYYSSLTGHEFTNEVACSRESHNCDTRRLVERRNHTHPVVIRTPPTDLTLFEPLSQVRRECVRLGVVPMTGPVNSIDHRCRLLQMKVVDFHRKKMLVYESQRRQQWRTDISVPDAAMLKTFSHHHRSGCLRNALAAKSLDRACLIIEAGADPSTEIRGGLFSLMAAVLKRSVPDIQRLLAAGADIDTGNSRGMTALMWAVKRDDCAMVDALLDEGADVGVEGCSGWTAMSIAARHGRRSIAQVLMEVIRRDKIAGEMNADRVLNHRSTANKGLTPVAIAAIHRDEAMVRCLMRLGAKPGVKCHRGYVAGEHAAEAGWTVLGLWLQETQAFGANGVYTFADVNAETALRLAGGRMLGAISSGVTVEDEMDKARKKKAATSVAARAPQQQGTGLEAPTLSKSPSRDQPSSLCDITDIRLGQQRSNITLAVTILKEGRAAPDSETDSGQTALMSAAYRGLEHSVRLLILEGADPNFSNRNNRTALMAAAAAGHRRIALELLRHGADAAWLDIDGKAAGAYAFERGHHELAELLAIAASNGNEVAFEWELEREQREEEQQQHEQTDTVLDRAGGGVGDVNEGDLHGWMIRVTKPREAAIRLAKKAETGNGGGTVSEGPDKVECSGGVPSREQPRNQNRCPKCTLLVPCVHFASLACLKAGFPDGVPEWAWNKRGVKRLGAKSVRGKPSSLNVLGSTDEVSGGEKGIDWWRALHQVHRNRALPRQILAETVPCAKRDEKS